MNRIATLTLAALASAALASCGGSPSAAAQRGAAASAASSGSLIGDAIDHALAKADAQIATGNLQLSDAPAGAPRAEITPQGDLLIGGKAVALTPAQRTETLAYREQLVTIARDGMAIGKQGAALGMQAAGDALAGVFSGKSSGQMQAEVEAKTTGIRDAASKLCARLPALMASQRKLAADLPAFKPYATMTQKDVDDCHASATSS